MSPLKHSTNIAARMGRWSARHRKTAIFGWLAFVFVAFAIGTAVGTQKIDDADANVGEARKADHIIRDSGFAIDEQGEFVLVQSKTKTVDDPAFRAVVVQTVRAARRLPAGDEASLATRGRQRRPDLEGRSLGADRVQPEGLVRRCGRVHRHDHGRNRRGAGSQPRLLRRRGRHGLDRQGPPGDVQVSARRAGLLSIPLTLRILLLVFGSLVGASIPLLLGLTSVFATMGLLALPSHFVPMDENVSAVVLLIGLAVGVDYSLFYIRRERDERRAGRSESAALEAAAATSGRAVLISGVTVMIAMAGMFFSGDKTFMSFAIATMTVVAVAMIGSLTVLPAMLSWLGDRVDEVRVPLLGARAEPTARGGSGERSSTASSGARSSRPWPRTATVAVLARIRH